ncbi:hypothetical protein BD309DRAFT_970780 [Dichomitus squalens]|nr:hypothetical protein BD309DRAFT_970780 [Dichomitus squalens]
MYQCYKRYRVRLMASCVLSHAMKQARRQRCEHKAGCCRLAVIRVLRAGAIWAQVPG